MTNAAHPPDAWSLVAALIDVRDADGVADAVRDLDEDGRRAVAAALPGHVKKARAGLEPWEDILHLAPAFRAAGAGTIGGAAAVASWLTRRDFTPRWGGGHADTDLLMDVLAVRDDAWRADLAQRLALRLRGPRNIGLGLVLALLEDTGAEPPEHDPLVVGWVASGPPRPKDPLLPALLPRLFEAEGVGRSLRENRSWPRTLATMAHRGDVDRAALVDGCVSRFLRGGTEVELRFFVRLHHLLTHGDPSDRVRETAERARDYAALLASAPGPVANLALELLREVPDLPAARLTEALDGLLFRPEAGLVRSGLSWLRETVRDRSELADDCARALAQAFGHESYGVKEKAVRLALTLPDGTDGKPLADAVPLLPSDLGTQVAARFGGGVVTEEETDDDPAPEALAPAVPRPREPEPLPEPITTPAELARVFAGHHLEVEPFMEGFVRLVHADPDAVRAAIASVLNRFAWPHFGGHDDWEYVSEWLTVAARMLADPASVPADWRDRMHSGSDGSLDRLALHRAAEIVGAVEAGTLPPVLLATPTDPTGHLSPAVLVDRLQTLADAGAEPGPADLQQALLRLPSDPQPEASRRAAGLDTPAARTAARWLAAPPVPRVSVQAGERHLPDTVIDLDGLEGPLADPGLDTTFPFPDDDPSDADDAVGFHAVARAYGMQAYVESGAFHGAADVFVAHVSDDPSPDGGTDEIPGWSALVDTSSDDEAEDAPDTAEDAADGEAPKFGWQPFDADPTAAVPPDVHPAGAHRLQPGLRVSTAYGSRPPWMRSRRKRLGLVDDGPTGLPLVDAVFAAPRRYPPKFGWDPAGWLRRIPSHPEVAAAHLAARLPDGHYSSGPVSPVSAFLRLAPADGMFAEHVADFLADRLGERGPDRVFIDICARGELPAAAVGRNVARLLAEGDVRPSRMIGGLERGAEAGMFADVWRVLAAALPLLCPGPGERPVHGLDRLIALGTRTARWCGARETIPEIDALAARKGSAAYVRAARDLAAQLTA